MLENQQVSKCKEGVLFSVTYCILQDTISAMESTSRELVEYETTDKRCPFKEWLDTLRDLQARAIIRKRLNRVRLGNLGVNRNVGSGVWELKIDFGPGYRIYYSEDGPRIVVLLCGGDKSSQTRDIAQAQEYWKEYQS